jgi:hypothetical protein
MRSTRIRGLETGLMFVLTACGDRVGEGKHASASGSGAESTTSSSTDATGAVESGQVDVDDGDPQYADVGARFEDVPPERGDLSCGEPPALSSGVCDTDLVDRDHVSVLICSPPSDVTECPPVDSEWARAKIESCACMRDVPPLGPLCGPIVDELGRCCYWYYDYWCPPPP